jgi:hypothetical protein
LPGEVGDDAGLALDEHQLGAVVHLVLLGPEQDLEPDSHLRSRRDVRAMIGPTVLGTGARVRMPLDDDLLADYIDRFYGYGCYQGDWWLVGMEEGSGGTASEVTTRLQLWNGRGRQELADVDMFRSSHPDLAKWFTPRPPLQPTWRGLIRLILSAEGRPTDTETARAYQGTELGRIGGNTCILELLPLPSRSVGHWIYCDHSSLPELRTRQRYVEQIAPKRVEHLRARVHEHRPKAVIFYSRNYQSWWQQIVGAPFEAAVPPGVQLCQTGDTLFAMTVHPTYRGVTTEYFVSSGRAVADRLRP